MARTSNAMAETQANNPPDALTRERVVIAGLGRAGLEYACAFAMHPHAEVAGFIEPRTDLRRFARSVGFGAHAQPTLSRWLDKHPCDTLVVCAPPQEAAQVVERGVDAGLGILVHGLAAMPGEIATRIHKALAASQRPVGAGAGVLFHPLFARARRCGALANERVTQVRASASVSRVFSPLADPGRDVLDFLLADMLLLLDASFGPVVAVKASGQKLYGHWIDECQVEARFANGLTAKVDASWSVPDYPGAAMVIEAMTSEGRVIVSDDALEMDVPPLQGRFVAASEPTPARFDIGDSSLVVDGYLRAVAGDASSADALSVARGARVARVVDAVRSSIDNEQIEREVAP